MKSSRHWDMFLRIPPPSTTDLAPQVDELWLAERGVYGGAPIVLGLLCDKVLPLVRELERHFQLAQFYFLIHDYQSGVPVPATDKSSYVHLRLTFEKPQRLVEKFLNERSGPWEMTRPVFDEGGPPSGIDASLFASDDAGAAVRSILHAQSKLVLDLIAAHKKDVDLGKLVMQVRQFWHFFANMTQVRIVG